jgi:hypothetical protein
MLPLAGKDGTMGQLVLRAQQDSRDSVGLGASWGKEEDPDPNV